MSPLTAVLVLSVAATVITLLLGVNTYYASQLDPQRPSEKEEERPRERVGSPF